MKLPVKRHLNVMTTRGGSPSGSTFEIVSDIYAIILAGLDVVEGQGPCWHEAITEVYQLVGLYNRFQAKCEDNNRNVSG